jgi:hypothetical protein
MISSCSLVTKHGYGSTFVELDSVGGCVSEILKNLSRISVVCNFRAEKPVGLPRGPVQNGVQVNSATFLKLSIQY